MIGGDQARSGDCRPLPGRFVSGVCRNFGCSTACQNRLWRCRDSVRAAAIQLAAGKESGDNGVAGNLGEFLCLGLGAHRVISVAVFCLQVYVLHTLVSEVNRKRYIRMQNDSQPELTPAANRAARGILKWSVRDLADRAGIAFTTVQRFETTGNATETTKSKMIAAYAAAHVQIIDDGGTGAMLIDGYSAGETEPEETTL